MQSIFDIVTAQAVASYWNDVPNTENYMGEELFPVKKQLGTKISYIKGNRGIPVEIRLSSLDAKTMIRDRRGFNEIETKMPFFKEGMYLDEDLRQKLLLVMATGNQTYIYSVLTEVFDDEIELIKGARVTRERMCMELVATGKISMGNNGQAYEYDYGLEEYQKETLTTTNKWSDIENSNPIADLNRWADAVQAKTGIRPTRAIMSSKVFNYIVENKNVAKSIYITNNGQGIVTPTMVLDAIRVLANISVAINDTIYGEVGTDGTKGTRFYPDNLVTLLPPTTLGNLIYGTTPEEADLMSNPNVANVKLVDTGVAVTTTKETDPVNVFTKVSQMAMPSFEQADKIFIGTVADATP